MPGDLFIEAYEKKYLSCHFFYKHIVGCVKSRYTGFC